MEEYIYIFYYEIFFYLEYVVCKISVLNGLNKYILRVFIRFIVDIMCNLIML